LALLRRPDALLAGAFWDLSHTDGETVARTLVDSYPFLFNGSHPFALHEVVRESLRAELRLRGHELKEWPQLENGLRRGLNLIQERLAQIEQAAGDIDERYALSEWREAIFDNIHLLLWLGEDEAARRRLLNVWIEARYADPVAAERLAALAVERASAAPAWRQLAQVIRIKEKYALLAPFTALMEPTARAVFFYLRAEQLRLLPNVDDEADNINHSIALLEQSYALEKNWRRLQIVLAEAYVQRGRYRAAQQEAYTQALADYNRAVA
jgi:hypothetical protein